MTFKDDRYGQPRRPAPVRSETPPDRLWEALTMVPPELEEAEQLLGQGTYDPAALSKLSIDLVWHYVSECWDHFQDTAVRGDEEIPELGSSSILKVLTLLLRYGADPNAVIDGENLMDTVRHLDHGYLAADALVLLFEHGGDPNLDLGSETLFDEIDFDVFFDATEQQFRHRYASLVHCWMVCLAYGGKCSNGASTVKIAAGTDIRTLCDHRQFFFGLTKGGGWPDIHIFRKDDLWEVVCG